MGIEWYTVSYLVDGRQLRDLRTVQHTQSQADHLQVLTTRGGRDVAGLGANIIDNGSLQPRDEEVCTLVHDLLLHSGQSVEDDSAGTTANIVNGGVEEVDSGRDGHGEAVDLLEEGRHGDGVMSEGTGTSAATEKRP